MLVLTVLAIAGSLFRSLGRYEACIICNEITVIKVCFLVKNRMVQQSKCNIFVSMVRSAILKLSFCLVLFTQLYPPTQIFNPDISRDVVSKVNDLGDAVLNPCVTGDAVRKQTFCLLNLETLQLFLSVPSIQKLVVFWSQRNVIQLIFCLMCNRRGYKNNFSVILVFIS